MTDSIMPALSIFSVGVLVGAGVALLVAPRPGAEIRTSIGERVGRLRRRGVNDSSAELSAQE